jgi:hypothetical protein
VRWVFVRGDDWEGLYIDGTLRTESHSLETANVARIAVNYPPTSVAVEWADNKWLEDRGSLPSSQEEIVLEAQD